MALTLVTAPAAELLTTAEAKSHLRIESSVTADDTLIDNLVKAARQWAETFTGRAFINQTWDLKLDAFPAGGEEIAMPLAPLSSVTSITYVDSAGASQTWAASKYTVDAPSGPEAMAGRIVPAYGETYPTTRGVINAVTIRFVAGYGSASSNVPEAIRQAIRLIVGHLYENRQSVAVSAGGLAVAAVPQTAEWLLWPYRVMRFA